MKPFSSAVRLRGPSKRLDAMIDTLRAAKGLPRSIDMLMAKVGEVMQQERERKEREGR
jgi:hypothetical protein